MALLATDQKRRHIGSGSRESSIKGRKAFANLVGSLQHGTPGHHAWSIEAKYLNAWYPASGQSAMRIWCPKVGFTPWPMWQLHPNWQARFASAKLPPQAGTRVTREKGISQDV
eukprot:1161345-Pelagomonas_calceolata.AAC.2